MSQSNSPQLGPTRNPIWTNMFPGQDLDTFTIGVDRSPGQCTIKKAPNIQLWQKLQGAAMSGGYVVPMGEDIVDIEIEMYFWLWSQVQAWMTFSAKWFKKATVRPAGGTSSLALSIGHPILAAPPISITKVVYQSCTELQVDEYDGWGCTVGFMLFRPPTLAPSRPPAAIPSAAKPPPTAQDQAQAVIQQNAKEIAGLASAVLGTGTQ